MSGLLLDVSGHSVKSVSIVEEQVLPCLHMAGVEEGDAAATS